MSVGTNNAVNSADKRIAVIDIGTVSTRLFIADCKQTGIEPIVRKSTITELGEGRAQSSSLDQKAIERTLNCVEEYVQELKEHKAQYAVCILTSAARDADNILDLLSQLEALGLKAQVIPGDVEARLAFAGVAFDFIDKKIMLVDIGGGSTEIAVGCVRMEHDQEESSSYSFDIDSVRSFDVGCRRLRELFEKHDPPLAGDLANAREFLSEEFGSYFSDIDDLDAVVCVGGTATSSLAVSKELEPYDSSQVHLAVLNGGQVADMIDSFISMSLHNRAQIKGLQEKRAHLIVSGSLILETVMALSASSYIQVSEHDLLYGLSYVVLAQLEQRPLQLDWKAELSVFCENTCSI